MGFDKTSSNLFKIKPVAENTNTQEYFVYRKEEKYFFNVKLIKRSEQTSNKYVTNLF